jgi:hypothetical protein
MPNQLTHGTFHSHVGSPFRVLVNGGSVGLTLVQVSPVRVSPRAEAFSLLFHGPAHAALTQAEYSFEHDEIGEFNLFIVPVGEDRGVLHYEAVFNRLLPRQ